MPNLNLRLACKWCDESGILSTACRPCGGAENACRVPQWQNLRVQFFNEDFPEWDTEQLTFSQGVGCCGTTAKNYLVGGSNFPGPFYQWGYWFKQRFYGTEKFEFWIQDSVSPFGVRNYYDPVFLWDFTSYRTGSATLVWHYYFSLDNIRCNVLPIRVSGVCKYRVFVSIEGTHQQSQFVQRVTNDGRPDPCVFELMDSLSGFVEVNYNYPPPCYFPSNTWTPRCQFGDYAPAGSNPYTHIMPYYVEQESEPFAGATTTPVRRTYCLDIDALPEEPIELSSFSTTCPTTCGTLSDLGSFTPPAFTPLLTRLVDGTTSGPGPTYPVTPGTLGPSPHSPCDPITPPLPSGVGARRDMHYAQRDWTLMQESEDGIDPNTVLGPVDIGTWKIQFSAT